MEQNTDPSIVVLTREQYDKLVEMADVGFGEFGQRDRMPDLLYPISQQNPHLPQIEKPKPRINWATASMVEIEAWIDERAQRNEAGFQLEAFNALISPIERTMNEFMCRPASSENMRNANYEAKQELARWRERYEHCQALQSDAYDCWIEFNGSTLNIAYTEGMQKLRAGNADLCLARTVFTKIAMKNAERI